MSNRRKSIWRMERVSAAVVAVVALSIVLGSRPAAGSLSLLPAGPQLGTHVGNLVVNGSFEANAPPPGPPLWFWATGTSSLPFLLPAAWQSSGSANAYAHWGSDSVSPPYRIAGSDVLPHGHAGMYFGNAATTVDLAPTFNASREVTFSGTPTFTMLYGQPVRLWQTVPTHLNPSPAYLLSFWASGEQAGNFIGGPGHDGIFGLRLTNVLSGDPIQYLVVPSGGSSPFGASTRYEFLFTPLDPSQPVVVEFINWGHLDLSNHGGMGTTELVIDDVIVNAIPEPGAAGLLAGGLAFLGRRRR